MTFRQKDALKFVSVVVLATAFTTFALITGKYPEAQAQLQVTDTFEWPEMRGATHYGSGVYSLLTTDPDGFGIILAFFKQENPNVKVVTIATDGFAKKYENPQITKRYWVICDHAGQ